MTQYNGVNVTFLDTQLNKLKLTTKRVTRVNIRL